MPFRHDPEMEIRYLRYFVAVADASSITAAASRLRVAQPALSRQLLALEHEVGVSLLERSSRGITLTDAGTVLAKEARAILASIEHAVESARAVARGDTGQLRVGYAPSPTAELLPPALQKLARTTPRAKVLLHDLGGNELLSGLETGEIDFGVMVDPGALIPSTVVFHPLKSYRHCVAVPRDHPFARLRVVPLVRVAAEPLVGYDPRHYGEYFQTVKAVLAPVTKEPRLAMECDGLSSLLAAVGAGAGVAIVPEVFSLLAGGKVRLRPISPPGPQVVVGYAHRADRTLSPIARKLIQALKQTARPEASSGGGITAVEKRGRRSAST